MHPKNASFGAAVEKAFESLDPDQMNLFYPAEGNQRKKAHPGALSGDCGRDMKWEEKVNVCDI